MVNTHFWTGTSQRGISEWPEKKDRSQPSVMSPGKDGMSRRAAKVKPRPEPPPQDPGGRFRGTYAQGPSGNDAWRWCACAMYPSSTPGRQQSSSWTEETERYPGFPSSQRRIRNGSPRELVCPRYRLPEPEGDRVLGDLLVLRPAVTNNCSHRGRCAAVRSR